MYPGEDRASTSEPEGHLGEAAPLSERLNCPISFPAFWVWTLIDSSLLEGADEQGSLTTLVSGRGIHWKIFF